MVAKQQAPKLPSRIEANTLLLMMKTILTSDARTATSRLLPTDECRYVLP